MGRPDDPHFGSPPPAARETARRPRGDRRLDPVRRRRPSRGTLLRLSAAAALLATAAVTSWSPTKSWSPTNKCGARAPSVTASASFAVVAPFSSAAAMSAASSPATTGVVPPGSVGVPVRLADPTALGLVHPGNRVDLLRLDETGASTAVAASALVLRVTGAGDPTAGGLLLAVSPTEAQRAVAQPAHGFAILIRPG
jgi:hypothetical protein